MPIAAPEATAAGRGRGPAEPAPGGGRRVPLVGAPERADDAVDLRRGQRVSASYPRHPKVSFCSILFFLQLFSFLVIRMKRKLVPFPTL